MKIATDAEQAKRQVDEHYKKVAKRWQERVTDGPFMQQLRTGKLPEKALKIFFKNWGSYTIEINTLEAASYHKHIAFFRKHRDLMGPMAAKLADELIHPKPPGHVHVVVETAKALTTHYGLTREQAVYFSTHEEADLEEHEGVMGHGSFRRLVLQRLFEDGMATVRPGYSLEYCGLTAVDLHGVCLQVALDAASRVGN